MKVMPNCVRSAGDCWTMRTAGWTDAVTGSISQPASNAHTLLPTGDEGKDKSGHAIGGAENDTLSSDSCHQAFASGEWGIGKSGI